MICKRSIIVINDNSLWGKYVLRNADFRFGTPSRSHFLTHQVANHQENSWDIPSFFVLQTWDIPSLKALRFLGYPNFFRIAILGYPNFFVPIVFANRYPKQKNSSGLRHFSNRSQFVCITVSTFRYYSRMITVYPVFNIVEMVTQHSASFYKFHP